MSRLGRAGVGEDGVNSYHSGISRNAPIAQLDVPLRLHCIKCRGTRSANPRGVDPQHRGPDSNLGWAQLSPAHRCQILLPLITVSVLPSARFYEAVYTMCLRVRLDQY